jgi:hypothetical protein
MTTFCQLIGLKFMECSSEMLHLEQSFGAETWTLWKSDQKYLKVFKCGAGEGGRRSVGSCEK